MSLPKPDQPDDIEKKREALKALSNDLGITNMRADIDSLHENVAYIRKGFDEMVVSWQQFNTQMQQNQTQTSPAITPTTTPVQTQYGLPTDPLAKAQALATVTTPLVELVKAWKGTPSGNIPQSSQLVDIIMNSFTKLMQIQVDNAILNTYPNASQFIKPPSFVKTISHEPV